MDYGHIPFSSSVLGASSSRAIRLSFVVILALIQLSVGVLAERSGRSSRAGAGAGAGAGASPSKVKVSVYYESLCPDSQKFMTRQFYPTWRDLSHIMEVDLNAYGKAHETGDGLTFFCRCQHGPSECDGNKLLTCAKKHMKDVDDFITFSQCIMSEFRGAEAASLCAEKTKVDISDTDACFKGVEGERLLHETGVSQDTLKPRLDYVPWILINDRYMADQINECEQDLRKVVCDAYKGPLPSGCP